VVRFYSPIKAVVGAASSSGSSSSSHGLDSDGRTN